MMRRGFFYGLLLLVVLAGGLIAFAPLSFVLRQSEIADRGLGWQQARGTIWQGQITGLTWQGDGVGAVNISSNLLRIFSGKPSHEARWSGPAGQGVALVKVERNGGIAEDISLSIPLTERLGTDPQLAQFGGYLRLVNGQVRYRNGECVAASGTVSTDIVRLAAASFDRDWPVLSGSLACSSGNLAATLSGDASDGTQIILEGSLSGDLEIVIANADRDVRNALLSAGFVEEGDTYTYTHSDPFNEVTP